jgi:hypothetical protein
VLKFVIEVSFVDFDTSSSMACLLFADATSRNFRKQK